MFAAVRSTRNYSHAISYLFTSVYFRKSVSFCVRDSLVVIIAVIMETRRMPSNLSRLSLTGASSLSQHSHHDDADQSTEVRRRIHVWMHVRSMPPSLALALTAIPRCRLDITVSSAQGADKFLPWSLSPSTSVQRRRQFRLDSTRSYLIPEVDRVNDVGRAFCDADAIRCYEQEAEEGRSDASHGMTSQKRLEHERMRDVGLLLEHLDKVVRVPQHEDALFEVVSVEEMEEQLCDVPQPEKHEDDDKRLELVDTRPVHLLDYDRSEVPGKSITSDPGFKDILPRERVYDASKQDLSDVKCWASTDAGLSYNLTFKALVLFPPTLLKSEGIESRQRGRRILKGEKENEKIVQQHHDRARSLREEQAEEAGKLQRRRGKHVLRRGVRGKI
eukprot:746050-Hanusia_phi.AAC.2